VPHASLSLPARLHLLACDASTAEAADAVQLPQLVRAGALTELAQRGLLVDEDGIATPVDLDADTGDDVLDGLLELVRESRPHEWRAWVTLRPRTTLDAVREDLAKGGYLRPRKKRALGLLPTVDYALERPAEVVALQEEARRILWGPVPAVEVSDRDAALVALAAVAELPALVSHRGGAEGVARVDGRVDGRMDARIEELIERGGQAALAVREVVREVAREVRAAMPEATSATGG